MKQCAVCHKDLPSPLDEFGPIQAPVCLTHFWTYQDAEIELERNETEAEDLEAEIAELQAELDELEARQRRLQKMVRPLKSAKPWPMVKLEIEVSK